MYVISSPALSSANAACASERSPSMSGHIARRHGPIGGIAAPATTAHATIAANGAPAGRAANAVSAAAASIAPGTSTAGCPRRSAIRPSAGAHAAEASAYSPAATPAAANEPVSSFVRSTNTSPSAVTGTRATIDATNTRAEPGTRRTASTRSSVAGRATRVERFGHRRIGTIATVISFVFGPEDLGRVRFAISPLFELVSSLDVLRDPAAHSLHERWAQEAAKAVKDLDFWLLDAAAPEVGYCYRPDFIAPPPTKPVAELHPELERVRETSYEQVARELGWAYPRGLPPGAKRLLDEGLDGLVDAMASYWERAIEPHWPEVKAILEADIASRAAQLAAAGPL